jgi:hypothetical protein
MVGTAVVLDSQGNPCHCKRPRPVRKGVKDKGSAKKCHAGKQKGGTVAGTA